MNISNTWLFSKKIDSLVFFVLPFLIPLCLYFSELFLFENLSESVIFILLTFLISDGIHVYITYGLTYLDRNELKIRKFTYFVIPFLFILGNALIFIYWEAWIAKFCFAAFSVFHFIKQQNAWFFIVANKNKRAPLVQFFDNWAMRSITWGFIFLSLTPPNQFGWFSPNDLFMLPEWMAPYLIGLISFFFLGYVIVNIKEVIDKKSLDLGKHLIFFSALIIWGIFRLVPKYFPGIPNINYYLILLIYFHHALPYLFLTSRYLNKNSDQLTNNFLFNQFMPKKSLFLFVVLFSLIFAYLQFARSKGLGLIMGVESTKIAAPGIWEASVWYAFSYFHYYMDGYLWKGKKNPKGRKLLN